MIAVYQPNYFDQEHPFCTREFKAMCGLESRRLPLLPETERTHGLIIPIVLRGKNEIPPEITDSRHYEDFSRFTLIDKELSKNPLYAVKIQEIAQYIHGRCQCFASVPAAFDGIEDFRLPSENDAKAWLTSIKLPRTRFPGAGAT